MAAIWMIKNKYGQKKNVRRKQTQNERRKEIDRYL